MEAFANINDLLAKERILQVSEEVFLWRMALAMRAVRTAGKPKSLGIVVTLILWTANKVAATAAVSRENVQVAAAPRRPFDPVRD